MKAAKWRYFGQTGAHVVELPGGTNFPVEDVPLEQCLALTEHHPAPTLDEQLIQFTRDQAPPPKPTAPPV